MLRTPGSPELGSSAPQHLNGKLVSPRLPVIDAFNSAYARMEKHVRPLLDRKNAGEPRQNFSLGDAKLVEGFELVKYVRGKVMGADTPLHPAGGDFTYEAKFQRKKGGDFTVREGIPVDPLMDFLNEEVRRVIGTPEELTLGAALRREYVILKNNSIRYADAHPELRYVTFGDRLEAEAWIVGEDKWRNRGSNRRNWDVADSDLNWTRRELTMPTPSSPPRRPRLAI